ncbi:MAG: Rrf2 family transcriptional regulator [Spirochaetales bacterium]|jgi:Rrf2 family protein|nr:Rrf2 family transcriptional regulator [Exilispira sp.]NMC67906.1 Rrf2 family transcriptional regulator [Spirochaetales bacterium]
MKKNSILYFSDASMLAIHSLILLAKKKDSYINTKQLAKSLGASENHLAKVMQILSKNGYVSSIKGPTGGFKLSINPEKINLKEIIELIEGPLIPDFCPFFKNCNPKDCIFGDEIKDYADKIIKMLENKNIYQISKKTNFDMKTD